MKIIQYFVICSLFFFIFTQASSAIERRRPQFSTDLGYIVAPFPFVLPGVGTGYGVLAGLNNMFETQMDLNAIVIRGDLEMQGLVLTDVNVIPETLLLDLVSFELSYGQQRSYLERGMESDPDEFNIIEMEDSEFYGGRAILTFFDRMFELFVFSFQGGFKVSAILDNEGETQTEIEDPEKQTFRSTSGGMLIDYTDDRIDARQGLRIEITRSESPAADDDAVEYYGMEYSTTAFLPVLSFSTWVFHHFRSDAHVTRKGETDPDVLKAEYGCFEVEFSQCNEAVQEVVEDRIAQNKYGNSSGLGGQSRLRAFSQGRFGAAHTEFYGTELRWNLTDEKTPFDFGFIRDVRTGVQLAAFYEIGTVADRTEDLWNISRSSTGVGARLVTSSGFVYRFDIANGEEGNSVVVIFGYPWGSF